MRLAVLASLALITACFDPVPSGSGDDTDSETGSSGGTDSPSTTDSPSGSGPSGSGADDATGPTSADETGDSNGSSAGDGDDDDDGDDGTDTGADVTPPTVISISPETGARGVDSDVQIVLEFSEPMARTSTEAAWESSSIGSVAMSWNDDDTVLTVVPDMVFQYARGSDPSTTQANEYGFTLGTTATDKAGNALEEAVTSNFFTWRVIVLTLEQVENRTGLAYQADTQINATTATVYVGDVQGNTQQKTVATFTLPELPSDYDEIVSAVFSAQQTAVSGVPYGASPGLGSIQALHVRFDTNSAAFTATPLSNLGIFSSDATLGVKTIDALPAVLSDYQARRSVAQFRLEFPTATNNNGTVDRASFSKETVRLRMNYRLP